MRLRVLLVAFILFVAPIVSEGQGKRQALGKNYFPTGVFRRGHSDGNFAANWFAGQLAALEEQPLKNGVPKDETVYRFLYLPTFDHPTSIRVTIHASGSATVDIRTASGKGGYDPGEMSSRKSQELSVADTQPILDLLSKPDFWREPSEVETGGCDGAEWILEGAAVGKYHVVDRWEGGSLRPVGEYLLRKFGPPGAKSMLF